MRASDLTRTVVLDLRRMRFRLVLTVSGVIIGTASVVLMMAVGAGMQRSLTEQLDSFGSATQISVYPIGGNPFTGNMGAGGNRRPRRLDARAVRELSGLDGVEAAVGERVYQGTLTIDDHDTQVQVKSVESRAFGKLALEIDEGDEMRSANELVLGNGLPALLLGGQPGMPDQPRLDTLGKRATLELAMLDPVAAEDGAAGAAEEAPARKLNLRVAGVLAAGGFEADYTVYVPSSAMQKITHESKRAQFPQATVRVVSAEDVQPVSDAISKMGFEVFSFRQEAEGMQQIFLIVQAVLGGIGGISLLVASLGIANTMTMATYERTKEIGIMKAVGASKRQITRVFLGESAAIGLLGGATGLALSAGIAFLGNLAMASVLQGDDLFFIPGWLAVFAVAFATLVGLLAGFLPALRASNLDPLVALRHE